MFPQSNRWDFENKNYWSLAKHEWSTKRNSNREEVALSAQRCITPNYNQEEVALSAQGCAKPFLVQRGLR